MTTPEQATPVRAAVVQAGAVPFDTEACVDKAIRLIAEASGLDAKVIVFPEAFIPGYPKGVNYGLVVGARDPAGREEFRLYLEAAIEVPGPQTQRLGEAAAAHGAHVVIGVIEREDGTCYCTVLFFGPDGSLLGKHRKLMPTAMERLIWGLGDGSTLPVIDTPIRPNRRGDLLGELHAHAAHGNVCEERRAVLRAHRGRSRHLAGVDAAHCARGALLRTVRLPVRPQEGLPKRCASRSANRPKQS